MEKDQFFRPQRTAIKRSRFSLPLRHLLQCGLIDEIESILDYGCGYGSDVQLLSKRQKRSVWGYDPYQPVELGFDKLPSDRCFDVVLCTYVLNVVQPEDEREIFTNIASLMHPTSAAYFSVRRDVAKDGSIFKHPDGTYHVQRYIELPNAYFTLMFENSKFAIYATSQFSLKHYIKDILSHEAE